MMYKMICEKRARNGSATMLHISVRNHGRQLRLDFVNPAQLGTEMSPLIVFQRPAILPHRLRNHEQQVIRFLALFVRALDKMTKDPQP